MDPQTMGLISAAVVGLTQLFKWANVIPDRYGPLVVMVWSAIGVLLWAWSEGQLQRHLAFDLFSGGVVIALAAAGIYGYTRAAAEGVTKMSPPPSTGAGSERTV